MAADDIVRGAAKAGSWLSDLLGVADEAISPAVAKAARNMMKDTFSLLDSGDRAGAGNRSVLATTKRVIDSDVPTEALKRIADLSRRNVETAYNSGIMAPSTRSAVRRMADIGRNIDSIISPENVETYKLLNNYHDLSPESAKILSNALVYVPPVHNQNGVFMTQEAINRAHDTLRYQLPEFQRRLYPEELLSEFGENSPAASMFSSFIDDGMSPADAREAVRALLG